MPMQGTGSHVCGVYKCGRGPGAKVPLEASSSTELAWDGGSQGIRKPTLLVELVCFQGPMEKNIKRHSRGPRPAPALGTAYIEQQSKKQSRRWGEKKVKKETF